jgi:trigger factor
MNVVVEHTGPCRKTLKISATGGELKDDFENVIASFMRDSQLPGFRAGKAPRARVEKHYEKGILDAVKDEALSRLYHEAVREQKVTPVSIIDVRDTKVSRTEGIQFTVLVDVPPEFTLPAYKKLSVDARPVAVADDEMQQAFDRMINAFSRFEDVTGRAAAEGDLVQVDYSGTCGGQPM